MSQLTSSSAIQVQGTNDSSIVSKLSMVDHGYFHDPYLKFFVQKPQRRCPLINRGYYIRAKVASHVITKFLSDVEGKKQIVNLGAGFDTTYFRCRDDFLYDDVYFVEIDYPDVMQRKVNLAKSADLFTYDEIKSKSEKVIYRLKHYLAVGYDLREPGAELVKLLKKNGVDCKIPTLFMSEVVLTYLTGSQSSRILSWANHNFHHAFFFVLEQMLPNDGFGHVMCSHFQKLGSPLSSINEFPTLHSHKLRHKRHGFSECTSTDLYRFNLVLDFKERERIEDLEMFDEFEGWHQMSLHYFALFSTNANDDIRQLCEFMFNWDCVDPVAHTEVTERVRICETISQTLQLFGHAAAFDVSLSNEKSTSDAVLIFGGFGVPLSANEGCNQSHQRLSTVYFLDLHTCQTVQCIPEGKCISHPMFATVVKHRNVKNEEVFILFGGRTSPILATNVVQRITLVPTEDGSSLQPRYYCEATSVDKKLVTPSARWRHSATFLPASRNVENDKMIVIGGRDKDRVFGDCWSFDLKKNSWNNMKLNFEDRHLHRHTHSVTIWKMNGRDTLVISGGLNKNNNPTNDLLLMQFSDEVNCTVKRLKAAPSLIPRYGHSSHVVAGDILLLVGGIIFPTDAHIRVSELSTQDHVAVVDLKSSSWIKTILFPSLYCDKPLRVHSHTSKVEYFPESDQCKLTIIGGGSNCFSFGTHFNQTPISCTFQLKVN